MIKANCSQIDMGYGIKELEKILQKAKVLESKVLLWEATWEKTLFEHTEKANMWMCPSHVQQPDSIFSLGPLQWKPFLHLSGCSVFAFFPPDIYNEREHCAS